MLQYSSAPLRHFSARQIKPQGWLKRQLQIQAAGLAGNLDKMWPDVRDSKWIGGDKEGWERVPYWLDGFIPLAYLLDDKDMQLRAAKYIDAILAQQKEDGWICPCEDNERIGYDVWAVFLICKVLVLYYECTEDPRIEQAVYAALYNLYQWTLRHTLFNWAASRWYECMIAINWLYDRRPESWLEELARALSIQGFNYQLLIRNFTDTGYRRQWKQISHVVNLAMAIKAYAVSARFVPEDGNAFAKEFLGVLQKYHGTAFGLFSGDECLAGTSPIQGTELCAIVEAMYSFEVLFEATGDISWLDRLEKLAFNALPATVSEDMWSHQYVQQVNQVSCKIQDREKLPIYTTNNHEANLFGLEPNFGCCTANMGQGFPKFALSTYYQKEQSIYTAAIAPASLETRVGDSNVKITCQTNYPFEDRVTYHIQCDRPTEFSFCIRIPETAEKAWVNETAVSSGKFHRIQKIWVTDTVSIKLQMTPKLTERPSGMFVAERGNLLFALPISYTSIMHEYERDGVIRKHPYCDYELLPASAWNYGFAGTELACHFRSDWLDAFSTQVPPMTITASMAQVEWNSHPEYPDICDHTPISLEMRSPVTKMELYPYGCTKLRMTEMPLL